MPPIDKCNDNTFNLVLHALRAMKTILTAIRSRH